MHSKKCNHCNKQIPFESTFCPYCGNEINQNSECPSCGKEVSDKYDYCPYCGQYMKIDHPLYESKGTDALKTTVSRNFVLEAVPEYTTNTSTAPDKSFTLSPQLKLVLYWLFILIGLPILMCLFL